MSLLDDPAAQKLLKDAKLSPAAVEACSARLNRFLRRYLPLFYRKEQRKNAAIVIRGRLSGLERKTSEPIAIQSGVERKPIQSFVGAGKWDDEAVMAELRCHVGEKLADPNAVLVVDSSAFPKKGIESCGVQRQWCGRLGKIDNCQVGVFLVYAGRNGHAALDRRLYLPREWAADPERRKKCHVPREVVFQEKWQIADQQLATHGAQLPHGWIAGDDEFGRVTEFRKRLRERHERYVLDVPCNTLVRDLERRPRRRRRKNPFLRADEWAARRRASQWQKFQVRDGEKGPLEVEALSVAVQTKEEGRVGSEERLVVIRTVEKTTYHLTNAAAEVPLSELVRARAERHRIEEVFQEGNGEVGLDHYEVRSWVGWHHHMTLAMVAMWFLSLERRRVGGENPGGDAVAVASGVHPVAAVSGSISRRDRRRCDSCVAA